MAKEEELSRSENIIFWGLFLTIGAALLFVTGIAERTLITTSNYLLYSFIAAIPLCIFIYKSAWGFLFKEKIVYSILTLILVTISVMLSFTVINYAFAKQIPIETNYKIQKTFEQNILRSSKKRTFIGIKHKDKEMSLKIYSKPLSEVQEYSHVNIQKWQGFFGYGADIVKAMELHNNQ